MGGVGSGSRGPELIGRRFGKLIVVSLVGLGEGSQPTNRQWMCNCDCGNTALVITHNLLHGKSKTCGQCKTWRVEAGQRFGRWVVIEKTVGRKGRKGGSKWLCQCDCGVARIQTAYDLLRGHSKGCRKCMENRGGPSLLPEYYSWKGAQRRCNNPNDHNYKNYGGRGIKFDEGWARDINKFLEDVGRRPSPKHSLERINVDGNYEPGNVCWATPKEQANNRRKKYTLEEAARLFNVKGDWRQIVNIERD